MSEKRRCVLALDPGTKQTGFCLYNQDLKRPVPKHFGKEPNEAVLVELRTLGPVAMYADNLAIEMIGHYGKGMAVGNDVFQTCLWIGRFIEAWENLQLPPVTLIRRPTIKAWLCGSAKAKDSNVRQSIIDRFGGDLQAIGAVKCPTCKGKGWKGRGRPTCPACNGSKWETPPGPLYDVKADAWSALSVAMYFAEILDWGLTGSARNQPARRIAAKEVV